MMLKLTISTRKQATPKKLMANATATPATAATPQCPIDCVRCVTRAEGNRHFAEGNYEAAVAEFTRGIDTMGEGGGCLHLLLGNRAECLLRSCMFREAEEDTRKACTLAPCWTKGYLRLSKALLGRADLDGGPEDPQLRADALRTLMTALVVAYAPNRKPSSDRWLLVLQGMKEAGDIEGPCCGVLRSDGSARDCTAIEVAKGLDDETAYSLLSKLPGDSERSHAGNQSSVQPRGTACSSPHTAELEAKRDRMISAARARQVNKAAEI